MPNKTPLHQAHLDSKATMADFHGWMLPMHYGSQIEEHHAVRQDAGMFDVSHMNIVDLHGEEAEAFLRHLLANDVAKLEDGKALYTPMLNEVGGIVDDLIVYRISPTFYRCVMNAGVRDKDLAWVKNHAKRFKLDIKAREDLAIIAVQGPHAREKAAGVLPEALQSSASALKMFRFAMAFDAEWLVARTGYTGEDGFEVILPADQAETFWRALLAKGIQPCGLGARDTLRLEAGLNLYGSDMDEGVTPLESNLAWTIAWEPADRQFIGRVALEHQKTEQHSHLMGVLLEERGVLRVGQKVFQNEQAIGEVVSGTFSPTLKQGIAFARLEKASETACHVEIRGKHLRARIIKLPFVRKGKAVFEAISKEKRVIHE